MRYSLNPEFDTKLKSAFDEIAYHEEGREALLELMGRCCFSFLR